MAAVGSPKIHGRVSGAVARDLAANIAERRTYKEMPKITEEDVQSARNSVFDSVFGMGGRGRVLRFD